MPKIRVDDLRNRSITILKALNVPDDDAGIVADSIVYAHTRGKHTHGAGRITIYARKIKEGLMNSQTPMTLITDMAAVAIYDAENGFGQVAAIRGMDAAIHKAFKYGVGVVGIRNSNNFGTAGFIGEYASNQGLISVVLANSGPAIAPIGGKKAIFGTNPICISFPPEGQHPPIIFDMACSNAARGKIRIAAKDGEKIPYGWAMDKDGNDTNDPNEALKGTMMPMGGYKGFGLAMCVDIIAGMLTGSAYGGNAKNLNHPTDISRYGHFLIAINPDFFLSKEQYDRRLSEVIHNIKSCGEADNVYFPGEKSYQEACVNRVEVEINEKIIKDMDKLIVSLNADE